MKSEDLKKRPGACEKLKEIQYGWSADFKGKTVKCEARKVFISQ